LGCCPFPKRRKKSSYERLWMAASFNSRRWPWLENIEGKRKDESCIEGPTRGSCQRSESMKSDQRLGQLMDNGKGLRVWAEQK
jgi:hypothetical protein